MSYDKPVDEALMTVSDGYHTMAELYDHRCILFINLCLMDPPRAAWRLDHPGWFVLYLETKHGQVSYHCPEKFLHLIRGPIKEQPEYQFDGHTSPDVLHRLALSAAHLGNPS